VNVKLVPRLSTWIAITAARPPTKTRWSACPRVREARPASASASRSAAGGRRTTASAKSTISQRDDPRTAKKSALSSRRSKSGWANANADRAARCAPFRPSVRSVDRGKRDVRTGTVETADAGDSARGVKEKTLTRGAARHEAAPI
jgi:hypothetical protein